MAGVVCLRGQEAVGGAGYRTVSGWRAEPERRQVMVDTNDKQGIRGMRVDSAACKAMGGRNYDAIRAAVMLVGKRACMLLGDEEHRNIVDAMEEVDLEDWEYYLNLKEDE